MQIKTMILAAAFGSATALMMAGSAWADDAATADAAATDATATEKTPFTNGVYVAPMGFYVGSDDSEQKNGGEGDLLVGYRKGFYGFEVGAIYGGYPGGGRRRGVVVNGLLYPFKDALPGLYLIAGVGTLTYNGYPDLSRHFHTVTTAAGAGYLLPIQFGNYEFGVRAEVEYRYGKREKFLDDSDIDFDAPRYFNDVIAGIGLQLPLSAKMPPPPPPEPAAVVDVAKDSDGDGVPDDRDQCPGTPAGTAVDDKGCPLPPPPPPCKAPAAGERISLAGCATGDVIVLRGVNFEFDKSKLTANAKTILDNVGDELKAYPSIKVEVAGHTDAKGSDEYNQKLSESRAASVMAYLVKLGIADERLTTVGYGEAQPIADNDTDEGRELNRRVELRILSGVVDASAPAAELAARPADAAPAPADTAAEPEAAAAPAGDIPVEEPAAVTTP